MNTPPPPLIRARPESCLEGYTGPLCRSCDAGYFGFSGDQCSKCDPERIFAELSTLIILLVVVLVLLVVAYFRKQVGVWLRHLSEDFRELKNKGRVLLITYQILVPQGTSEADPNPRTN